MYKPHPRIAEIMNWSLDRVKAVPYDVSLRWLFYQAFQASESKIVPWSLKKGKGEYNHFKSWTIFVRKNFWNGWSPNTLVDEGRSIEIYGQGHPTPDSWKKSFKDEKCVLDKRLTQKEVVLICFEAGAMLRQFEYETKKYYVPLVPFRGDAGIYLKWLISKKIEQYSKYYQKPVRILYFGDLDKKGEEIPESAMNDIRKWCSVDFQYTHVGLKQEHVKKWNLPENPDKPGYQWEALDDSMARELIVGALDQYIDLSKIKKVIALENKTTKEWIDFLDNLD